MTDTSNRLAVLTCDGCGEPLAIGEADWVLCPACSKRVVVPEPYRALRDAHLETDAARTQVEAFYRTLARGPRLLRWLVRRAGKQRAVPLLAALAMVYALALLVSPIVILWGAWQIFAVEPRVNVYQVLGPLERGFAYACAVYLALVVPALGFWVLGWNRRRRRANLTAALAAGLPTREGGPAVCRTCGAPLSVAPGTCGSTCLYCHAENLIVPRGDVLDSAEQTAVTLDDVIAEEAWQRRKVRRGLAAALLAPAVAAVLMMIAVWLVAGEAYAWDTGGSLRCSQPVCTEWRRERLRRGRALEVEVRGSAAGPPKLRLEGQAITPFPRAWTSVAEIGIDANGRADVLAPWDGWFRVVVEVPGPADASFRTK
jgi:DNA-directed RNA polymerase subunit RPC12/RpoP